MLGLSQEVSALFLACNGSVAKRLLCLQIGALEVNFFPESCVFVLLQETCPKRRDSPFILSVTSLAAIASAKDGLWFGREASINRKERTYYHKKRLVSHYVCKNSSHQVRAQARIDVIFQIVVHSSYNLHPMGLHL